MPHSLAHSKCFSYIYESTPLLQPYSGIAGHKKTYLNPGFFTEMLLVLSLSFIAKRWYTTKCISTLCCFMWYQTKIYSTYCF